MMFEHYWFFAVFCVQQQLIDVIYLFHFVLEVVHLFSGSGQFFGMSPAGATCRDRDILKATAAELEPRMSLMAWMVLFLAG